MDLGQTRRGVDMGPSAIRIARVGQNLRDLGYEVSDMGNISVHVAESRLKDAGQNHFIDEITESCRQLADATFQSLNEGAIPVVLGGDHSIAMGSIAGISKHFRQKKKKVGVIWFDAHADINTPETSLSGNVHGMPVAHILGFGSAKLQSVSDVIPMVEPRNFVQIGLRDLDPAERDMVKKSGIRAFTMRDIDEQGLRQVVDQAIRIASDGTEGFHCSCDVDWLDPAVAPGVGTPVRGGATYREGHLAMEMLADSGKLVSLEITEVNPVLDVKNETAQIAAELILSAFGKKVL